MSREAACRTDLVSVVGGGSAPALVSHHAHKVNAARRRHIPRPKRRVLNWAEYDAALRRRGSLTNWVSQEAIVSWKGAPRSTPGGQPSSSDLAITTALMLGAAFRLALRQTEGLIRSVLHLLGLDLPVRCGREPAKAAPHHRRPSAPAGGQHQAEAVRAGRVADREARHEEAALLEEAARRDGRGAWPDRCRHADRSRRR